jgi:hypothetical protein
MADWNEESNVCRVKLVFYGPALSGKTTNLISLYHSLQPDLKGDMQVLETQNDRTLFFDLLPIGVTTASGALIKIKVYTVPGQVAHDSTRKALLSRADGVVFVADSQLSQSENNAESFKNLAENSAKVGLNFENMPLVIQFNKRDLTAIVTEQELHQRWSKTPWSLYLASAINNQGVLETFAGLLEKVYFQLDQEFLLEQEHGLNKSQFMQQIMGSAHYAR